MQRSGVLIAMNEWNGMDWDEIELYEMADEK